MDEESFVLAIDIAREKYDKVKFMVVLKDNTFIWFNDFIMVDEEHALLETDEDCVVISYGEIKRLHFFSV